MFLCSPDLLLYKLICKPSSKVQNYCIISFSLLFRVESCQKWQIWLINPHLSTFNGMFGVWQIYQIAIDRWNFNRWLVKWLAIVINQYQYNFGEALMSRL